MEDSILYYSVRRNDAVHTTYAQAECNLMKFSKICDQASRQLGMDPYMVEAVVKVVLKEAISEVECGYRVNIADVISLYPKVHTTVKDTKDANGEWLIADAKDIKPKKPDAEICSEVHKKVNKSYRRYIQFERVKPNIKRPNQKKKKK